MVHYMIEPKIGNVSSNVYDDGDIPEVDLPRDKEKNSDKDPYEVEPLPESSRPRKDGPGGA